MKCETMKPEPFAMGGSVGKATHRCTNTATHLVSGKTKQERKQAPMALCAECLKVFLERNPDYTNLVTEAK